MSTRPSRSSTTCQQRLDRLGPRHVAFDTHGRHAGGRRDFRGPRLGVRAPDVGEHRDAAGRGDRLGVLDAEKTGAAGHDGDASLE